MEARLRRAEDQAGRLPAGSPAGYDEIMAMIHVQARLGTVLRRLGRSDQADDRYRQAIELAGTLLDRDPRDVRARVDRADTREALALLDLERGRKDEALTLLAAAAADLQSVAVKGPMPSIADRFEDLSEDYEGLGDPGRAEEMAARASRLRSRIGPPPA
jgi:tetratricopeptide (TPR) repeat protein